MTLDVPSTSLSPTTESGMEGGGEGMVAVVRGLRDSGLAVTLLDGSRQYTLMPNVGNPHSPSRSLSPSSTRVNVTHCASGASRAECARSDSAAQATDGRYASMYKMAHCRVTPTSPPVQLTEFPPQRAELCPGHGNFEVGGSGSGENYSPCSGLFRGAMSWPDSGSVCSPRPSREPDAFANSLRKYPNVSLERSTEMVERLITYTRAKNRFDRAEVLPVFHAFTGCDTVSAFHGRGKKSAFDAWFAYPEATLGFKALVQQNLAEADSFIQKFIITMYDRSSPCTTVNECRKYLFTKKDRQLENIPPTEGALHQHTLRAMYQVNTSDQVALDRNNSRNTVPRTGSCQRNSYAPEVNNTNKTRPRMEESPTKDQRADCDCTEYRRQVLRADNYCKDMARKVRENVSGITPYPYNQPMISPVARERYEHNNLSGQKPTQVLSATTSVNMEVQAAAEMVSKEVATTPRAESTQRNVAVPQSPTSSMDYQKPEGDVSDQRHAKLNIIPPNYKAVETGSMPTDLSDQTAPSCVDIESKEHRNNHLGLAIERRTKSSEILHTGFSEEIFELLEKVSVRPNSDPQACDLRYQVLEEISVKIKKMAENINWNESLDDTEDKIGQLLQYVPIWVPSGDVQAYKHAISDEIMTRMNRYRSTDIYRVETKLYVTNEERNLDIFLANWFSNIPLMNCDRFGKPADKEKIKRTSTTRIKHLIQTNLKNKSSSHKSKIVHMISKFPLAVNEYNKFEYLNNLTESLLNNFDKFTSTKYRYMSEYGPSNQGRTNTKKVFRNYIQPTEEELKECISDEVKQFLEQKCSTTNSVSITDVEIEIIDYLIDSIQAIRLGEDYVESELTMLLCQDIDNISWSDAKEVAQIFLKLVKDMFDTNTHQESTQPMSYQTQSYIVQNAATFTPKKSKNNASQESSNFSIEGISKRDIDANLDAYMNQLTAQIDEWLASLQMHFPQANDLGFRQVVVHDLAEDIIDRHKYLELNPTSRGSDTDELEHLKFQIFKWINKLAGDNNMDTVRHAPELMQRIQRIPLPMLTRPQHNNTETGTTGPHKAFNANSVPRPDNLTSQVLPMSINKSRPSNNQSQQVMPDMSATCCSSTRLKPTTPSVKKLNEEYDVFLKKWVQEIPICSATPSEKALADKARAGIYNGVWKAITKLKFEPATFNNLFYYEDALDDELEDLLSSLPKSSELETKKHLLKVQLIEKTTNMNELIKSSAAPASFKQQLVETVVNSLHQTSNKDEPKKPNEELQILKLVEDYILCANFKEVDQVKANIYRTKLIKEAQTLVNNLKRSHGKELEDIDSDIYINNIFTALHKVPLPNEDTVRDEAEEIMLAAEVEQWMLDIPVPANDGNEQLQRKKLKDALVKRIREIENEVNIFDCSGEKVLKHVISSFLEKVPLKQGENLNITFMTEEFANRMRNRAKELQAGNATRKSVAFMDSVGYYEFSQQMPHCSSFSESPGAKPAVANQSSYMIREGSRVKDPYGYNYYADASLPPHVPLPSDEYFTLEDSQATPKTNQPLPQPMQEHNQYSKMQSYKSTPPLTLHGTIDQSIAPQAQSYHDTVRDRTISPTIERQQSLCCRSPAGNITPQPMIPDTNQSGQARGSNSRVDSLPQPSMPHPQTPCFTKSQGNTSRLVSAQEQGTQLQASVPGEISAGPLPYVSRRTSIPVPPAQSGSFRPVEQQQEYRRLSQSREALGQMSTYGEPQWFSTPQQAINQTSPPKPGRKKARGSLKNKNNLERRRLELDDDSEAGFESEVDEHCHCMDRMMMCRRPPVCYAYQDFDMDQRYLTPYGSLPLVTNNFTVRLCRDVRMEATADNQKPSRNSVTNMSIKSVQTSFSSVDLAPKEKCCDNCNRKIKSQENLRNRDRENIKLENEVLDWLRETCTGDVTSKWGEKMQRLAQKLNKPGGEERIRQKIQKYLRRVPNQFPGCEEESGELREQLPEKCLKKLKKMYQKPERRKHQSSPVRIFRIEIPKDYKNNTDNKLRGTIKIWIKDVPIKKKDLLGRRIEKEDVIDFLVLRLEPFILNRENFENDYTSRLKETIMGIMNEMYLDIIGFDKETDQNKLALSLLNDIMHISSNENHAEQLNAENSRHERCLREFISTQMINILQKLNLRASTKRLELLEEELKDVLKYSSTKDDTCYDGAVKNSIFTILQKLGGLSDYQANYFTDVILKHFKDCKDQMATTAVSHNNNTYSVYHHTNLENRNRKSMTNNKDLTRNEEINSGFSLYKLKVIVQIDEWLNELHVDISFGNRHKAIQELAEDIIDRFKYFEINPTSKGTDENELQYLRYQIFKWINKAAGENTMETIEHANELMMRIQSIETPASVKDKHTSKVPPSCKIKPSCSELKQIIVDCLDNMPGYFEDLSNRKEVVDELAFNIMSLIETENNVDDVLNREIGKWMANVYKSNHKWALKDTMKRSLNDFLQPRRSLRIDAKTEKATLRKYEDIIDKYIDDYAKAFRDILSVDDRNKHTHDLAVQLFNLIHSEEKVTTDYLENVTMKWLEIFMGKQPFWHECVTRLIESVLGYDIDELARINHNKSNADNFRISDEPNIKSSFNEKRARIDKGNNVIVYGVSLQSTPKVENTEAVDTSIQQINEDDINAGLDLYLKQLVEQIDNWLGTLNLPQIYDTGFREIVVNDLAGDIIDRHKYLELNPSSRGSDESELEQLKYQIFKWINKLVGDDQHETVEHASELMKRIRSIPVPMLTKHSETCEKKTNAANRNVDSENTKTIVKTNPSNVRLSSPLGFTTGPMATSNKQNVVKNPVLGPQVARSSLPDKSNTKITDKRLSGPPALGILKTPIQTKQIHSAEKEILQGEPLKEVYEYFAIIFQERVKEIPLETANPEQEALAELAKKGIYNGIWKTYLQLKANPDIENDYSYFEMVFEDQLDNMLDCLPQTSEIQNIRNAWKVKVLGDILCMLKHVHDVSDRPSFRQMIAKKFNRQFAKAQILKESNLIQQLCVANVAKKCILQSKFKTDDPVKAEVYRQRLMKKVEELAESIKSQANVDFRSIKKAQFCQMAMQLLATVPIPHDETLKDEAEEILITEEIDQWYNGLPVKPPRNDTDVDLRKRIRELLAKKLHEIEKRVDLDESAEQELRHEISKFLQEKAELQPNVDLQIGFMVEELTNRLKNRRQQNELGYESFEKEKPLSSTFAQTDPGEVLAPLVDAGVNLEEPSMFEHTGVHRVSFTSPVSGTSQVAGSNEQGHFYQGQMPQSVQDQTGLGNSVVAGPSSQVPSQRRTSQPFPCCQGGQGALGTNQTDQSARDPMQRRISHTPPPYSQSHASKSEQTYQQPMQEPCCQSPGILRTSQTAEFQGFGSVNRFPDQSFHSSHTERNQYPPNDVRCANRPSQMGPQLYPGSTLYPGRASQPSTDFLTQYPSAGATRSTRVVSSVGEEMDEETDGEEEIGYRCRCLERMWKCKKHPICEDWGPRCYPMPFPCRYFY